MPKITIEIMKGRTVEKKREMAEAMCATATHFFKVLPENILLRIDEIEPEDFFINGNDCNGPRDLTGRSFKEELFMTIFFIEGRSVDVLRGFAKEMTEKLSGILGIPGSGILIHFQDMKKDELSRCGLLICEM